MKRQNKKAFTLVELLVVIAILAVLATVSVLGYSAFIKKAHISNDTAIVAQMNLAMEAEEAGGAVVNTPTEALKIVYDAGFVVENLTPTTADYNLMFNIETKRFALFTESFEFVAGDKDSEKANNYNLFGFASKKSEFDLFYNGNYSIYLKDNADVNGMLDDGVLNIKAGLDCGNNTVSSVNYTNTGSEQNVVIRTNSLSTTLSVDAANDTITHYDLVNSVKVIRTAYASYHEKGTASYIECASGKVVVESEGKVNTVILTAVETAGDKAAVIKNNGGEVEHVYATTNDVATANNNAATEHDTLKVEVINDGGNVLADTEEAAATIVAEKKEVAIEENAATVQLTCEHNFVDNICSVCGLRNLYWTDVAITDDGFIWDSVENKYKISSANGLAAFAKKVNSGVDFSGKTIILTEDIDLSGYYWYPINCFANNYNRGYTFDGNNKVISNMTVKNTSETQRKAGLFADATGYTIKNVIVDGARVDAYNHAGVIVASMISGSIDNCKVYNSYVTVTVEKKANGSYDNGDKAGAICGYMSAQTTATCTNCYVENVEIKGYRDCGGLIGYAQGTTGLTVQNNILVNVTIINDQTQNNYQGYTQDSQYNVDLVVGRKDNSISTTNTTTNVTIEIKK